MRISTANFALTLYNNGTFFYDRDRASTIEYMNSGIVGKNRNITTNQTNLTLKSRFVILILPSFVRQPDDFKAHRETEPD